jgi:hypothetical protein
MCHFSGAFEHFSANLTFPLLQFTAFISMNLCALFMTKMNNYFHVELKFLIKLLFDGESKHRGLENYKIMA